MQAAALAGAGLLYRGSCHRCHQHNGCLWAAMCQLNAYHCSLIHSKPVIREKTMPATPNRQMAEIMVEEIGRRASGEPANNTAATAVLPVSSHREGYALAAGAALGLVTLGSGRSAPGISDLQLEDRLRCGLPACYHGPESDATPDRPLPGRAQRSLWCPPWL